MCRLAAYLGNEINLSEFLLAPEHSLVKQSWAPREMIDGTINADGYGLAWRCQDNTIGTHKNVFPIWSDVNLESLGRSLHSALWMGYVRGATPGQGISHANTQPFVTEDLIFIHNGCLKPFGSDLKIAIESKLSGQARSRISGDTDSNYLFALLQHHLIMTGEVAEAIIALMHDLGAMISQDGIALLNIIVHKEDTLYATRHALNDHCPSLYYSENNHLMIASEPLTSKKSWTRFPENKLISFNRHGPLQQFDL